MIDRRQLGVAAAIAASAALAVPATAGAHPTVYPTIAKAYDGAPPALRDVPRYVVINHGNTIVLTETNTLTGATGVVGYNLLPSGAYRNARSSSQLIADGATGAQAHATCIGGTSDLGNINKVLAWQGGDVAAPVPGNLQPFWGYVPFQTTSAGLDDDPASWTGVLVDAGFTLSELATRDGRVAACQAKGGTYRDADTIASTAASLATGLTAPLQSRINTLTGEKAALAADNKTLGARVDSLTQENAKLQATVFETSPLRSQVAALTQEVAALKAEAVPMTVSLDDVSAAGATANVTGKPASEVSVRLLLTEAQARRLKLRSAVLAAKTATTAADGTAAVTLKLSRAEARALRTFRGSFTAEAISGDRIATAKSRLARR